MRLYMCRGSGNETTCVEGLGMRLYMCTTQELKEAN